MYLKMLWLLSKLDMDPKLKPSFRICKGLLSGFLASVDVNRADAVLILHVFWVWLFPF